MIVDSYLFFSGLVNPGRHTNHDLGLKGCFGGFHRYEKVLLAFAARDKQIVVWDQERPSLKQELQFEQVVTSAQFKSGPAEKVELVVCTQVDI